MNKKSGPNFFNKYNMKWVLVIGIWTFVLAITFGIIAENLVNSLNILFAFLTLLFIIIIGIIFDIIGIAVARAEEKPFHSMAAKKISEAKIAIALVRNAGPVSNFCNDVVGDISGIISGAVGASLIYKLIDNYGFKNVTWLSILMTSLTASLTVGGKALGKSIALMYYEEIIINIAKFINIIETTFKIEFFPNKKKSNRSNKN